MISISIWIQELKQGPSVKLESNKLDCIYPWFLVDALLRQEGKLYDIEDFRINCVLPLQQNHRYIYKSFYKLLKHGLDLDYKKFLGNQELC